MKNSFQICIVIFLFSFCSSYSQSSGEIILSRNDVKFLSIRTLSDIYAILPQIDLYTLDGYRHTLLMNNILKNKPSDVLILINGVKTNFGFLDKVNLSQFPVNHELIDSIIVKYYPSNYSGEYSSGVLIDIITKTPPEDISLLFNYSTGNEVGDPGPYRYTKYFSDNVDQFGPTFSFTSSYGTKDFNLIFNFIDQVSPATDPAILKRTTNFNFQNYQVRYSGLSVNSSVKTDFSRHNLFLAFTKTGQPLLGNIYGADLYFDDNLSTEIPYEKESFYIVSGNGIYLNNKDKLVFDISFKHSDSKQSKLSNDFSFRFIDMFVNTKIGFASSLGLIKYFSGFSYDYQGLNNNNESSVYRRDIYSFFTTLDFITSKNLTNKIDFNFRGEKRTSGFSAGVSNIFQTDKQNLFKLSFSISNLSHFDNSFNFRTNNFLTSVQNDTIVNYSKTKDNLYYLINFDYTYRPDINTPINSGVTYFYEKGLNYVLNDFVYDDQKGIIENKNQELFTEIDGSRGEFYLNVKHKFFQDFENRFYYRYSSYLDGTEIYNNIIKKIPKHKISYTIFYKPFIDLYSSVIITYLSSTEWVEYRNVESADNDLYKNKLSNVFLVDCSITKYLWKERIKVTAAIMNILNPDLSLSQKILMTGIRRNKV
jgi:hypothetical protein